MPKSFLTTTQRESYGRYAGTLSTDELTRFFHLNDDDLVQIRTCRGDHNRMGYALQLTTVRYLGTFLNDPLAVPASVVQSISRQLHIKNLDRLQAYSDGERRWDHIASIREYYGYCEITEPLVGFLLSRWLFSLCWTGVDRPSTLFERATAWLLSHKILLPGSSTLERFILRLRVRAEERLWSMLGRGLTPDQKSRLQDLLAVEKDGRTSFLDQIRSGPIRVSGPSLRAAIKRLQLVRTAATIRALYSTRHAII